uniref:Protein TIS11 n=1 Tax=Globodera pallida TaxID=36090 RepID=A0A183CF66_GLOPA
MPPYNPSACYAVSSPPIPTPPTLASNSTNPSNNNSMVGSVLQQQQQQQQQQQKNPKLYKTELCRSWMEHGRCNYGERCQYAHGEKEKRPVPRHPKYKTEACQSYHKTGYCPYGPRCHFIHNENPSQLNALIEQNEKALRMVQELATLPINGSAAEIPRKSLMVVSSSSASLGNSPFGSMLQKNNSVHAFNSFHSHFLGKAQSNNALQQQQENCANFFPFNVQHKGHHHQLPVGLNLLGSNYPQYQQQENTFYSNQQCSPEKQHRHQQNQRLSSSSYESSYETYGGISSKHQRPTEIFRHGMTSPQLNHHYQISMGHPTSDSMSPFGKEQQHGHNNGNEWCMATKAQEICTSKGFAANNDLDPQQLLANLCSSDDEYSRSSLISSTADSGTESPPMAFDDDTLTKSNVGTKKLIGPQMIGHTLLPDTEDEAQHRRSSDGDTVKVNAVVNNYSTASSSLASLLSSSSSSHAQHKSPVAPNASKIRLPVFERLSLNQ